MNLKEYKADRANIAKNYFNNKCFCCERKFGKSFQFHHLERLDNEKKYSDFNGNLILYWEYLKPLILENPSRFVLLCIYHHRIVSLYTRSAKGKDTIIRLLLVIINTNDYINNLSNERTRKGRKT